MEILDTVILQDISLPFVLILVCGIMTGVFFLVSLVNDGLLEYQGVTITTGVITVIAIMLLLFWIPSEVPNGKIRYTVEITDDASYQFLIDQGYTAKCLYKNKQIYQIEGLPLDKLDEE